MSVRKADNTQKDTAKAAKEPALTAEKAVEATEEAKGEITEEKAEKAEEVPAKVEAAAEIMPEIPAEFPRPPIKVLFVASECAPFVKTGGLADVVGALPGVLRKKGVDVRVMKNVKI